MFEKHKVTKLKNDILNNLRVEIKDIMKKELESRHTNLTYRTTNSSSNYITDVESLKRELDIKERMIMQLLNTAKEISTVNMTQSVKPIPNFTCENETDTVIIITHA